MKKKATPLYDIFNSKQGGNRNHYKCCLKNLPYLASSLLEVSHSWGGGGGGEG